MPRRPTPSQSLTTFSSEPDDLSGANVYTTLQRLEAKRLVTTRLGEPRPERGGKPRRLVTVRPSGLAAVRATTDAIQAMVGELDEVIGETT